MTVPFSQRPGRHERHYRRRIGNPLFPDGPAVADVETLLEMQRLDHEELLDFLTALRRTVGEAVDLRPNEDSETVLALKERLDRLYEQSAAMADDQSGNQQAIAELLAVIMRNVRRGAGADPRALDELAQEDVARAAHFELLRSPLVADLLDPAGLVESGDLAAVLLSASATDLDKALALFDREQLARIRADADACLAACADPPAAAAARLAQIARALDAAG